MDLDIQLAANIRSGLQLLSAALALAVGWVGWQVALKFKLKLRRLPVILLLAAILLFVTSRIISATRLLFDQPEPDLWTEIATVLFMITATAGLSLLRRAEPQPSLPRESIDLDGLTKLYNQSYFRRAASRRIDHSRELDIPLALIMLEIDDFDSYNREFGREADRVLVRVAQILREVVRAGDLVARYDGAKFVVLLINYLEHACVAAEKIRSAIDSKCSPQYDPTLKRQVTVSLGVAAWKEQGGKVDNLIEAAEREMNRAKQAGKNRVSIATVQIPVNAV